MGYRGQGDPRLCLTLTLMAMQGIAKTGALALVVTQQLGRWPRRKEVAC